MNMRKMILVKTDNGEIHVAVDPTFTLKGLIGQLVYFTGLPEDKPYELSREDSTVVTTVSPFIFLEIQDGEAFILRTVDSDNPLSRFNQDGEE